MGNMSERQSQDGDEEQNAGQTFVKDRCQGSLNCCVWEKADDAVVWWKSHKLHDGLI